eukprot:scpid66748/ scgid24077/ Splicing regulatory glutamine/lysine-rich protein 1; Serine/arginine-rich-splicing regulatory protein 86; Splicing factor, arginine/serine-rich 12; Splicing regulatory protein 508
MGGRVVQVTGVAPEATEAHLKDIFGIIGDYSDLKLYPTIRDSSKVKARVCYVKYGDEETCLLAQHLTNTSLLDRPLIVVPVAADFLPDEETALAIAGDSVLADTSSAVKMPTTQPLPDNVTTSVPSIMGMSLSQIVPVPGMNPIMQLLASTAVPNQLITGASSRAALHSELYKGITGLAPEVSDPPLPGQVPPPPTLGGSVDPTKIEEIRRTVYVGNLNSQLAGEALVPFFEARCGEVLYVRMAGDETQPTRFVFVEFATPEAVNIALQYNGAMFGDRPLKVNHSKNAVVKPQIKTHDQASREVQATMEAVRRAQAEIGKEISVDDNRTRRRSRGRSNSPHRSRRRSRSYGRYSRSRSRSRERPSRHHSSRYSSRRYEDRSRRDRSRSRDRDRHTDRYRSRRSRSRDRRRSPSDSPSRRTARRHRKPSGSDSD